MSEGLRVRGAATAEEVAAVLAVLAHSGRPAGGEQDGYARWRETRRQALRRTGERDRPR
jgi:hypothetical protein